MSSVGKYKPAPARMNHIPSPAAQRRAEEDALVKRYVYTERDAAVVSASPQVHQRVEELRIYHADKMWINYQMWDYNPFQAFNWGLRLAKLKTERRGRRRVAKWLKELSPQLSQKRTFSRTLLIKEELVAAAFRPERVERWLEAGEGVLEMMFGA